MSGQAEGQSLKWVWWLMPPLLLVFFPYLWASGKWLAHPRANWGGRTFTLPFAWIQDPVGADFGFVATHPPPFLWGRETRLIIYHYETANIEPAIVVRNVEASAKDRGESIVPETESFFDLKRGAMFCSTGTFSSESLDLNCVSRDAQWMIVYIGSTSSRKQAQRIVTSYMAAKL